MRRSTFGGGTANLSSSMLSLANADADSQQIFEHVTAIANRLSEENPARLLAISQDMARSEELFQKGQAKAKQLVERLRTLPVIIQKRPEELCCKISTLEKMLADIDGDLAVKKAAEMEARDDLAQLKTLVERRTQVKELLQKQIDGDKENCAALSRGC